MYVASSDQAAMFSSTHGKSWVRVEGVWGGIHARRKLAAPQTVMTVQGLLGEEGGGGGREYLRDDDILSRKLSTSLHIYHSRDTCSAGYSVQLLKCYTSKKITSQNNDLFDKS